MSYMHPPVLKLKLHCKNEQNVLFDEEDDIEEVLDRNSKTMLTEWFVKNQQDPEARDLLYVDFPSYYTWSNNKWNRRKQKRTAGIDGEMSPMIGRIPVVALNTYTRETFFLRLLLHHVPGATSFEDLRTVTDPITGEIVQCNTNQEACIKLQLTENDKAAEEALNEAFNYCKNDKMMKYFFVNLVIHNLSANVWALFQKFTKELCADKMHKQNLEEPTEEIINDVLLEMETLFEKQDKNMAEFIGVENMPTAGPKEKVDPKELRSETNFDPNEQAEIVKERYELLNVGQEILVRTIKDAIDTGKGGIFAVEAHGGTGKTFCINILLAMLRAEGKIAVAMAISAQAATLFDGGRTVHFKLKVPIKLGTTTKCSFKENSATAEVIRRASLLVIDEYTMGDKKVYETIDRSFRDLLENNLPYGGKVVLHSGDWKQILPVIQNGHRSETVQASFKASYLWDAVKVLCLDENMRIKNACAEDKAFAQYLLDVGNGKIETHPEIGQDMIRIPESMRSKSENLKQLCEEIYPNLRERIKNGLKNMENHDWNHFVHERAIICPRNVDTEEVNRICLDMVDGQPMVYRSADRCIHKKDEIRYPTEYLNKILPSGCPPHVMVLKKGCPITLMRNMNPEHGHVNGAQYNVIELGKTFIHGKLAVGPYCKDTENADILIPRIKFLPEDKKLPFEFQRVQFPVRLDFAITSNRSQGKTYLKIGINLQSELFTHGQLYVSISRVGSPKNVIIFKPKSSSSFGYMRNVVYHEVLSKDRINSTTCYVDRNDVIGRNFGDLDSNVPTGRLSYSEAKLTLTKPRLDEEGFKLSDEETKADGNCFLHGIIDQMRKDPELSSNAELLTTDNLRNKVCESILDNENIHFALIPDDNDASDVDVQGWANNMKRDGCWADHPFIQLTANLLKRNIVIITIYKEDGTNGSGRIEIKADESTGCPLYLLNWDNIHFQSIFPKEDSTSN